MAPVSPSSSYDFTKPEEAIFLGRIYAADVVNNGLATQWRLLSRVGHFLFRRIYALSVPLMFHEDRTDISIRIQMTRTPFLWEGGTCNWPNSWSIYWTCNWPNSWSIYWMLETFVLWMDCSSYRYFFVGDGKLFEDGGDVTDYVTHLQGPIIKSKYKES